MKHLLNRLERLERRLGAEKRDRGIIPDTWPEFARSCTIRSGSKLIPFKAYDYQVEFIRQIEAHPLTVLLKARQLGATETLANYALWRAAKNPAFIAVFISKSQQDSSLIAKRLRAVIDAHESLELTTDNLTHLELKGGGQLLFKHSGINAVRGISSLDMLVLDECAFVNDAELIYSAAIPATAMASDPKIIILSTPNTQADFFYEQFSSNNGDRQVTEICEQIRAGQLPPCYYWTDAAGNCKFIVSWRAHPIYGSQENYLETIQQKTGLPMRDVYREFDLSFTSSSSAVFSPILIRNCAVLEGYEKPQQGDRLFIGIDPNFGGNDYFCASVLKQTGDSYSLIHLYRKRGETSDYHLFNLLALLDEYKPQRVAVEVNSGGIIIAEQIQREKTSLVIERFRTTHENKYSIVSRLLVAMEQDKLKLPNKPEVINDFLAFRKTDNNKLEAAQGKHDDVVMATAIALSVTDFSRKPSWQFNVQIAD